MLVDEPDDVAVGDDDGVGVDEGRNPNKTG